MVRWETRKIGRDRFAVWATYAYRVGEEQLEGQDWLNSEEYRNPWTIDRLMTRYPVTEVKVWHRGRQPEKSALTKRSARRPLVMAFFAAALGGYFIWMGRRYGKGVVRG